MQFEGEAVRIYATFLLSKGIISSRSGSLEGLIVENYEKLSETDVRDLVSLAIESRSSSSSSSISDAWSLIIDTFRSITAQKREVAKSNYGSFAATNLLTSVL